MESRSRIFQTSPAPAAPSACGIDAAPRGLAACHHALQAHDAFAKCAGSGQQARPPEKPRIRSRKRNPAGSGRLLGEQISAQSSSPRIRGTCTMMYQPPSTASMPAADPASASRANARLAARPLADLALHRFARGGSRGPPRCTGVLTERYVSAIHSSRQGLGGATARGRSPRSSPA